MTVSSHSFRSPANPGRFSKDYSIVQGNESDDAPGMVPPPTLNWGDKDGALFYEIEKSQGKGVRPVWVKRGDIRVHEAGPLAHVKTCTAVPKKEDGYRRGYSVRRVSIAAHLRVVR